MVGCLRLPMKEKANKTAMIHRTARHSRAEQPLLDDDLRWPNLFDLLALPLSTRRDERRNDRGDRGNKRDKDVGIHRFAPSLSLGCE
jgi:hypothetical protein